MGGTSLSDFGKVQYLLGYKVKVSFIEGIKRTVQWYNSAYRIKEAECYKGMKYNLINAEKPCIIHVNA